jgi:hypothetical protein
MNPQTPPESEEPVNVVREGGLEPPRPRAKAPKTFASTIPPLARQVIVLPGAAAVADQDRYGYGQSLDPEPDVALVRG